MLTELDSLMFYIFGLGLAAYLLDTIPMTESKRPFFHRMIKWIALGFPIAMGAYHVCGTDTGRYILSYLEMRKLTWDEVFKNQTLLSELGHKTLTKTMGYFNSVRLYFGVYSALIVLFMFNANKYFKPQSIAFASFSFYILFFLGSFNGMRQTLAMVIVAFSYKFVFEKKPMKFLLLVFLASSFHLSALVTLFVYFIWDRKNEKLISWPLLAMLLVTIAIVAFFLTDFLGIFSDMEFETDKLQSYMSYGEYSGEEEFNNYSFFVDVFVGIVFLLHYKRLVETDEKNSFFIYLYFIAVAMGLCGFISPYAKRIGWYFKIPIVFLFVDLPKCYEKYDSKWIWIARIMVILYILIRFIVMNLILGHSDIFPYIWYLPRWIQGY